MPYWQAIPRITKLNTFTCSYIQSNIYIGKKKRTPFEQRTKQTKIDPDNNFQQIYQITLQKEQNFHFFYSLLNKHESVNVPARKIGGDANVGFDGGVGRENEIDRP